MASVRDISEMHVRFVLNLRQHLFLAQMSLEHLLRSMQHIYTVVEELDIPPPTVVTVE